MGSHTRVVIVEDEPMLLGLLQDVLALGGYDSRGFHHLGLLDSMQVQPNLSLTRPREAAVNTQLELDTRRRSHRSQTSIEPC